MRILQTGVTHSDPARATPGFTLFSPLWGSETLILDMQGEVVHRWEMPTTLGGYGRLMPNGNLFVSVNTPTRPRFSGGAQGGRMLELDWDGAVVNEFVDDFQHHDCWRLPNGHTLYASWEEMPAERAALVRGGIAGSDDPEGMYSDVVREVDAEGNLVFEWHAYDMEIEKYEMNPLSARRVWAWCNTTFPLANGDVLISLRQINTCAIIDRQTGKFRWERTDPSWGGQHDPQMLANGNIILFANGWATHDVHSHSRIVEFDPETGEEAWVYKEAPTRNFYSHHISGQQRLPSGNTLICEGLWGRLFEVTPEGELVWEYISPFENASYDGNVVNWVFRALRYAEDSPEIAGRLKL